MPTPTTIETINIAEISAGTSNKGKAFWKIKTADGEFYTCWKEDVKDRLYAGINYVTLEINNTGDKVFKNIVGIAPGPEVDGGGFLAEMTGAPAPAAPPPPRPAAPVAPPRPAPAAPAPNNGPSQFIPIPAAGLTPAQQARIAALTAAAQMVTADIIKTTELVPLAEHYVQYILSGPREQNSDSLSAADYVER